MFGNILSRVLGMTREIVIADLFGAGRAVGAFTIASNVSTIIFDLLISGMISAALVPVLSEYAENAEKKEELWRIVSTLLSLTVVIFSAVIILLELIAPQIVWLMASGFDEQTHAMAVDLVRLVLPGVLFLGLSAVAMSTLYALQKFSYPALAGSALNAAVVVVGLVLAPRIGISSLVVGMLLGSVLMIGLQLPGLRGMTFTFTLDVRHPAVRRIAKLYLPVLLGLVVSQIGIILDRNLASRTGESSIAAMRYATTLIQFALGLVAAAISIAVLPTLSRHSVALDLESFRRTLATGLKMIVVLIVPAAGALFALAVPAVVLVFQHGSFNESDKWLTVLALLFYLPGLPFAAVDQLLIFAFYARRNTIVPVLVGVAGVVIYMGVALSLINSLGMAGLAIANSVQLTAHAVILFVLLRREIQGLGQHSLASTVIKVVLASTLLAGVAALAAVFISAHIGEVGLPQRAATVLGAAAMGIIVYVGAIRVLRVSEMDLIWRTAVAKLGRAT